MPIYEYECKVCHEKKEIIQGFNDPLLQICSSCGGELKKLISSASFVLKGTGWYITDYARNNGSKGKLDKKSSKDSDTTTGSDKA